MDPVVDVVAIENFADALLQLLNGTLGGKAEIEMRTQFTWNDIGCPGAGVNVGNLPRSRGKIFIAFIPSGGCQLGQRRREQVHGIAR